MKTVELIERMGAITTEAFGRLATRIKELEARIAAMETHSAKTLADAYRGSHLLNSQYSRGEIVTRGGALWLAMGETTATPGSAAEWKMIAKGGVE